MKFRMLMAALPVLGLGLLHAVPSNAQATRTWVSGVGDDANPCSRTAPCKTFAGAISKTAAGGEINCIDPGGFGGVTIVKSMSIICDTVEAGIVVAGTNGMTINAGVNDTVYISGIDFEGLANTATTPGLSGIKFNSGKKLIVHNVTIRNFGNNGIEMTPTGASSLAVSDSIISGNGSVTTSGNGIIIKPTATGSATGEISNVRLLNNYNGIKAKADVTSLDVRVTLKDSVVHNSTVNGAGAYGSTGKARLMVVGTDLSNNGVGLLADGANSKLWASNNSITNNTTGVSAVNSGSLQSYTNNQLTGNTVDGAFTNTVLPQ